MEIDAIPSRSHTPSHLENNLIVSSAWVAGVEIKKPTPTFLLKIIKIVSNGHKSFIPQVNSYTASPLFVFLNAARFNTPYDIIPVSYTHLDVYKRQHTHSV